MMLLCLLLMNIFFSIHETTKPVDIEKSVIFRPDGLIQTQTWTIRGKRP